MGELKVVFARLTVTGVLEDFIVLGASMFHIYIICHLDVCFVFVLSVIVHVFPTRSRLKKRVQHFLNVL